MYNKLKPTSERKENERNFNLYVQKKKKEKEKKKETYSYRFSFVRSLVVKKQDTKEDNLIE